MRIDSIRYKAFATNSSSVHTPIIMTNGTAEDYMVDECEFGWHHFVAATEEARRKYIGTALLHHLPIKDFEPKKAIIRDWVGVEIKEGYVDHQSLPLIPCRFGTTTPDREYFDHLLKWFTQKGLAIVGGNDNAEEEEHNEKWAIIDGIKRDHGGRVIKFPYPKDEGIGRIVCRFDPKGFYALFDRILGRRFECPSTMALT